MPWGARNMTEWEGQRFRAGGSAKALKFLTSIPYGFKISLWSLTIREAVFSRRRIEENVFKAEDVLKPEFIERPLDKLWSLISPLYMVDRIRMA